MSAEALLADAAHDLPSMILETGWFLTRDEHRADGEYPLPDQPNLRSLLTEFCREPLVLVPKSRQILVTWSVAAYAIAKALTQKHFLAIYQTKREDDAQSFMDRVRFMYDHLPDWLREIRPREKAPRDNRMRLELVTQDSKVWGIPSGADIIRMNTVSLFIADEVDFQPEAKASLRAAAPSLDGGQGIWISSLALGGLMTQLIHGEW